MKLKKKKTNIDLDKLKEFIKLIFKNKRKKIKNNIIYKKKDNIMIELLEKRVENISISELNYLFNKF